MYKEYKRMAEEIENSISRFQNKTGILVTEIKIDVLKVKEIDKDSFRVKQSFIYKFKDSDYYLEKADGEKILGTNSSKI